MDSALDILGIDRWRMDCYNKTNLGKAGLDDLMIIRD